MTVRAASPRWFVNRPHARGFGPVGVGCLLLVTCGAGIPPVGGTNAAAAPPHPLGAQAQSPPSPAGRDPIAAEIDRLVRQLGSSSYTTRTEATKRLIALGPRAGIALRRVAVGEDFEVALRARHLLDLFDELLFTGLAVELRTDRARIDWSDPINVEIHLINRSAHPVRVPFELSPPAPDAPPSALRRITAVLDLADYLEVTGPGGRPVRLHVDDLGDEPGAVDAVNRRVDHPPVSTVPEGDTIVHRVERLNRGPVRYRTLEAGPYRFRLVYQPQWNDPEMVRGGIGRVVSNELTITVEHAAPESVRRSGAPAALRLTRDGGDVVASVTNHSDVPLRINLNLARVQAMPFARVHWIVLCGDRREDWSPRDTDVFSSETFSLERIRELEPGESTALARLPSTALAELDPLMRDAGACTLSLFYSNVACRAWQRSNGGAPRGNPNAGPALLPRNMLVTSMTSNALPLKPSE